MSKVSIHSPAGDMTSGFDVGGGRTPPAPSVHPDISMTSKSGGGLSQGPGTRDMGEIGGVGSTSGAVPFSQLIDAPSSYDTGGDPMVGGIGKPPRP